MPIDNYFSEIVPAAKKRQEAYLLKAEAERREREREAWENARKKQPIKTKLSDEDILRAMKYYATGYGLGAISIMMDISEGKLRKQLQQPVANYLAGVRQKSLLKSHKSKSVKLNREALEGKLTSKGWTLTEWVEDMYLHHGMGVTVKRRFAGLGNSDLIPVKDALSAAENLGCFVDEIFVEPPKENKEKKA